MLLWSKSTIKEPERCHAVFIFNFEHIQQINLIFFVVNFEHILICWAQDKINKTI